MSPFIRRTRVCLLLVFVILTALFSYSAVYGQFGPGSPGNKPTGNDPFQKTYRCSKCGAVFTSGNVFGPPSCPNCSAQFIQDGPNLHGSSGPAAAKAGVGTFLVIVAGIGSFVALIFFAGLGPLIFFIARGGRRSPRPQPVGARSARRFRDGDYDA